MRIAMFGCPFAASLLLAVPAATAAQAVALPLRGEGELAAPGEVQPVEQGSVLFQSDSSVSIVFIQSGTPHTLLAGQWWMADRRTAELAVHAVLGGGTARGTGAIRFRPDGSIDDLEARGIANGREFAFRFQNATSVARSGHPGPATEPLETGALPGPRPDDDFPWGGHWAVVDASRRGEGRLEDGQGRAQRFDRARLTLGDNDEFMLVLDGDSRAVFAGTWHGDPRDSPVPLELREAMGQPVGGVGRAWLRQRSWDRNWSFERVELDGWNDDAGDAFTLYFEAKRP